MKSNELTFLEEISLHEVCEHGQLRAQLEHPRSHNNEHAHLNHKYLCTKDVFTQQNPLSPPYHLRFIVANNI